MSNGVITAAWIQGMSQFIPLAAATIVAAKGLSSWREQIRGKRQLELAESCLASAQEAAEAIRDARIPFFKNGPADPGNVDAQQGAPP